MTRTKQYYSVQFTNGTESTARLIVDDSLYPLGKTSVEHYSRLFPYTEAGKMKRLILGQPCPTFGEAFNQTNPTK